MKTFTATHLNKHAQEVFAAAKDDGGVTIKHDHFKHGRFIITWEKSYAGPDISMDDIKKAGDILDAQNIDPANRIIDKVDGRYYTGDKE